MPNVPYLIRRNSTFYYRARLAIGGPTRSRASHVTISLKTTDSGRARRLAAALAALRERLRMSPLMSTLSPAQVTRLFQNELLRQLHELDDLAARVRRLYDFDPETEAHSDRVMGWVWRLLAIYGRHRPLMFDAACPGRRALVEAGMPERDIWWIARTFAEEQALSRGTHGEAVADQAILGCGGDVTEMNRRRAFDELHRARAHAFNATERRYDMVREETADVIRAALSQQVSCSKTADRYETSAPFVASVETAAEMPVATEANTYSTKPDLPLTKACDLLQARAVQLIKKKEWTLKTAEQSLQTVDLFVRTMRDLDIEFSSQLRQHHLASFRDFLELIPTRYGQSAKLRSANVSTLRSMGEENRRKNLETGLSAKTVIRHFGALDALLKEVRARGYQMSSLELSLLRPRKPKTNVRNHSPKPKIDVVRNIFETPLFVGAARYDRLNVFGEQIYHRGSYFAVLLLAHTGARRGEIAGMTVDDVIDIEGIPAIHLRPQEVRGLKTEQSLRVLPIPSELIRLGFLEYHAAITERGYLTLFPDLFAINRPSTPGDRVYDELVSTLRAIKGRFDKWERLVHALRHGWNAGMKELGIQSEIRADILGHALKSETEGRYADAASLRLMQPAIEANVEMTRHLRSFPLKLLPEVERRDPPYWQRKQRATIEDSNTDS